MLRALTTHERDCYSEVSGLGLPANNDLQLCLIPKSNSDLSCGSTTLVGLVENDVTIVNGHACAFLCSVGDSRHHVPQNVESKCCLFSVRAMCGRSRCALAPERVEELTGVPRERWVDRDR